MALSLGRKTVETAKPTAPVGPSSADIVAQRLGAPRLGGLRRAMRGKGGGGRDGAPSSRSAMLGGGGLGGDGPKSRREMNAFLMAVAASVLLVAGTIAWLAVKAPDTLAKRAHETALPDMTLTLQDGTPRIAAQAKPLEADPLNKAVTLAPSRNDALVERTQTGALLPHVSDKGPAPWQAYARPFPADDTRPRIALVIADVGWSPTSLDLILARLPGAVTLAFAAGAPDLQAAVDKARADGHEALIQVPLEPQGFPRNDPGPNTLLTTLSDEKNVARLETAMSAATGYVGLTSLTGSKFLTNPEAVRAMMTQVQRRGLIYVDAWLTAGSLATRTATGLNVPRAVSDVMIDRVPTAAGIQAQLAELERLAKANGVAVGFAQPYPVTVEELANWFLTLRDRGVVLAPVSAVVNRQADR